MSVLDTSKNARKFDAARMVQNAIADGGPGAFRQAWQIFRLSLRKRKFTPSEYYDYGMFRPAVWKQVTETFLPENDNLSFSTSLSGAAYQEFEPLFLDKLKFEKWARSMGFPVAETLAVYAAEQPEDGFDWLSSKAEVESFLRDASNYPLFGKPIASSHSFGAVSMKSLAEDGQSILLGNGVTVSVEDIIAPIISDWADGYLLQRHMFNHPALKPHFGQATATSRIITLWAETGPEVLFFSQRLPSATAMHDNQSRNHRGHTNVNPATGVVESISVVHRGAMKPRRHWNNPDAEFVGMEIPFHKETVSLCQNVHRHFPTLAMIGFDIAITADGPIISEANLNPYLSSLQGVTMTGIYSEPMYSKFMTAKRLAHAAQQQVGV